MSKGRLVAALLLVVAASFKAVAALAYDARAHAGQCHLRATDDPEVYVLDVGANVLDRAPSIERRSLELTRNPEWRRLLDHYWNEVLKLT